MEIYSAEGNGKAKICFCLNPTPYTPVPTLPRVEKSYEKNAPCRRESGEFLFVRTRGNDARRPLCTLI